jgi:UDP-glucose 6-dehydrogenase/nucleoside-diphosphate-sugar epimerase
MIASERNPSTDRLGKHLAVMGLGHVGLPTVLGLAELGWEVTGADSDIGKICSLQNGRAPFYEPGLQGLLEKQLQTGRFRVAEHLDEAIRSSEVLFLCVGTPQKEDGEADLAQVDSVVRLIARNLNGYKLIVEKSTVPAITADWIKRTIKRYSGAEDPRNGGNRASRKSNGNGSHAGSPPRDFEVASNPEFLQEGNALRDFFHPSRIVCGVESQRARGILEEIYGSFECPLVFTDVRTAELVKHAANAFLATKVSFINMVADLSEAVGADVTQVALRIGLDPRIGAKFMKPDVGFGGYCLPKDLRAFIYLAEQHHVDFSLLREVERINQRRVDVCLSKLREALWVLCGKTIAVLGGAFKPGTDDIRGAPSVKIIGWLIGEGTVVRVHDPQAIANLQSALPQGAVTYWHDPYQAARGADALLLLTEWEEYRQLDWGRLREVVAVPLVVDGRNHLDALEVTRHGFEYFCIGRSGVQTRQAAVHDDIDEVSSSSRRDLTLTTRRPRTLVTGGAGLIGSHLCDRLIAEGHEVICLDSLITGSVENIHHLFVHPRFAFVQHDVCLPIDLPALLAKSAAAWGHGVRQSAPLDFVLHLASPASPVDYARHTIQTLKAGAIGTLHALGLARAHGSVFLLASTSEVYGDPKESPQPESYWGHVNPIGPRSVYDEAKRFAEALTMAYHRKHGVPVRLARIFNTYGERMRSDDGRVLPNFVTQALQDQPLTVYGNGSQTRSLCHVSDTVEGLYRLLLSNETGPVNLGNPEEVSILELAKEIIELTGSRSLVVFKSLPVDDPSCRRPDISKAIRVLGWQPKVNRRDGISRVIPFFKAKLEVLCLQTA